MTDELDRAEVEIERELEVARAFRQPPGPAPTGFCLYCGEPLPPAQRWCAGTGCCREWEVERAARVRNGDVP